VPVLYQIGLLYERLQQPQKAADTYQEILARQKELGTNSSPGLKTVMDMARWRSEFLNWQNSAELLNRTNFSAEPKLRAAR